MHEKVIKLLEGKDIQTLLSELNEMQEPKGIKFPHVLAYVLDKGETEREWFRRMLKEEFSYTRKKRVEIKTNKKKTAAAQEGETAAEQQDGQQGETAATEQEQEEIKQYEIIEVSGTRKRTFIEIRQEFLRAYMPHLIPAAPPERISMYDIADLI